MRHMYLHNIVITWAISILFLCEEMKNEHKILKMNTVFFMLFIFNIVPYVAISNSNIAFRLNVILFVCVWNSRTRKKRMANMYNIPYSKLFFCVRKKNIESATCLCCTSMRFSLKKDWWNRDESKKHKQKYQPELKEKNTQTKQVQYDWIKTVWIISCNSLELGKFDILCIL